MQQHVASVLVVGLVMVAAAAIETVARRSRAPDVVGWLLLGLALGVADRRWSLLGDDGREAFRLLADFGLVMLLFRIGLGSDLRGLLAKLRPAVLIWSCDVALSGLLGYLAARWAGLDATAAAVVAAALTATSIGVPAAIWQARGRLDTPDGRLLLDAAELDDLSGVVAMALLFAVLAAQVPIGGDLLLASVSALAGFAARFVLFALLCLLFARFVEHRLTRLAQRYEPAPLRMLTVVGCGVVIAAAAGALGFSLAIGALFAGLVFSRDAVAVHSRTQFAPLHAFFVPFFFVGIGFEVAPDTVLAGLALAAWLLPAAIAGKLFGAALPARRVTDRRGAWRIGISMLPRAEITLVIASQGRAIGVLDETGYAAVVAVSLLTCLIGAVWLARVLPPAPDAHGHPA